MKGIIPSKKELRKSMNFTNERIRERVNANIRKKVLERAKNKCERCKKVNNSEVRLDIHHKDQKSNNNRISNLIAVCPNCHRKEHNKYRRINKRDAIGMRIGSKLIKKKPVKKKISKRKIINKKRTKDILGLGKLPFKI